MEEQASEPVIAAARASADRCGILSGDRPCIRCGYNLIGQSITREPHYQMLIVTCPECGTVASLQEHPQLGKWGGRVAVALAGLLLLWVLALAVAATGLIYGASMGLASSRMYALQSFLAERQVEWARQAGQYYVRDPATGQLVPVAEGASTGSAGPAAAKAINLQAVDVSWEVHPDWVGANPPDELFRLWGGWPMLIQSLDGDDLAALFITGVVVWALAAALASTLLWIPRRLVWLVAIPLVGITVILGHLFDWDNGSGRMSLWELANRMLYWRMFNLIVVVLSAVLIAGLLLGRPLTRLLVRVVLPPRLRVPLSALWTCDGLEPPRPSFFAKGRRG